MGEQAQPSSTPNWLDHTLRQCAFLSALLERNRVRRSCLDALKLYRQVSAEHPQAGQRERYERVVARRTGADRAGVATILRRAEESFTSWIIPSTWKQTNLSAASTGSMVNLEFDMLAKYVERICKPGTSRDP